MKKALQAVKSARSNYNSAISGLNYKMTLKCNGASLGNLALNLNKNHKAHANLILKDVLQKQEYTLLRDSKKMIFEGTFEALKQLTEVTTYYPDTGLLVYDVNTQKLVLHLVKDDVACQGVVLGYVMDTSAASILSTLRTSNFTYQARLESTYNYYLKRTLNVSLAVSMLVFYNAFGGSQKFNFGAFVRDEKEFQPK